MGKKRRDLAPETLSDLVPLYLTALERRGLSVATRAIRHHGVALFVSFLARRRRRHPGEIRTHDAHDFQASLARRHVGRGPRAGQPLAPATIEAWTRSVRSFGQWLVRGGYCLLDPTADLPPIRRETSLPRVLTPAEAAGFIDTATASTPYALRNRAILEVFYAAGLRLGELVGLDLVDLDLAGGTVCVRRGKGDRSRRVPLGGAARRALIAYLERGRPALAVQARAATQPAVFLSRSGTRLERPGVYAMIVTHARRGGWGRVTPHTLRHTAAVHTLRGGADIRYVQELLGHADVATTTRYTRLELADLKAELARCHPRGRLGLA